MHSILRSQTLGFGSPRFSGLFSGKPGRVTGHGNNPRQRITSEEARQIEEVRNTGVAPLPLEVEQNLQSIARSADRVGRSGSHVAQAVVEACETAEKELKGTKKYKCASVMQQWKMQEDLRKTTTADVERRWSAHADKNAYPETFETTDNPVRKASEAVSGLISNIADPIITPVRVVGEVTGGVGGIFHGLNRAFGYLGMSEEEKVEARLIDETWDKNKHVNRSVVERHIKSKKKNS